MGAEGPWVEPGGTHGAPAPSEQVLCSEVRPQTATERERCGPRSPRGLVSAAKVEPQA